ncbi:V-type proton ATPase 116 kDa subunit a 1-like isoform X2 [Sycon ciliatum]|uniref:V-type proton ATPase 116 kDa subunit a 1-like isoform X2 n=1 Tax=Sycon ciliatum TaxID=27933 RepID=UPI0020AE45D7|eukprot:scpid31946/ scgid18451/ V-type proton ATPase 116 kDa subunit a isoform 1; Clathrin-coated vesicle/synaptic vesicle proton pump 116 kDa subunit; Vacuolar adenosine triphosphatase subunit Ac116; Vacuolar proton pump subunit 1; Vacuolar proton translocating ATPase 116 kDa subunit a isoform 1
MGSLFRSEEMTLAQLYLQSDAAYRSISEMGELGLAQFRDLNPDVNQFQRRYVNEVRRCDEMERRLRYLKKEIEVANVLIAPLPEGRLLEAPPPDRMLDLEEKLKETEDELKEVTANQERLNCNFLELTELKHILEKTGQFYNEAQFVMTSGEAYIDQFELEDIDSTQIPTSTSGASLMSVAGVINRERIPSFERLLWRACRGNVFIRQAEIEEPMEDPTTRDELRKNVFIIFMQGQQLASRVRKICDGFRATLYPIADKQAERREMLASVRARIEDLTSVLAQTTDHRLLLLQGIAQHLEEWIVVAHKSKGIYHTMNMCNVDLTSKCLIAECWCPVDQLDEIQAALQRGQRKSSSQVPSILNRMETKLKPPTYNKVNKFTAAFQNIVDAYGVATYREVNPTPYTIITFPFLFAVMFGDCGHGLLMALFALYLVVNEKKLAHMKGGEITGTFFGGRYIILLMGAFSIYTGIIYNDCFSKSFNVFGSSWHINEEITEKTEETVDLSVDTDFDKHNPYPFGLDPIWQLASNKLTFTNSFKMKLSVVMGVGQMMFGVILGVFNHLHFNRKVNIYAQFVPEVLFLGGIFGYLTFMIFFKWILVDTTFNAGMAGPPSLLITLINMFLSFGNVEKENEFFAGQAGIQSILVVIAVLCVPWMLMMKPIILYMRNKKSKRYGMLATAVIRPTGDDTEHLVVNEDEDDRDASAAVMGLENGRSDEPESAAGGHGDEEEFNIGDILVHQGIHTIEFCLGCISNTASYLRLWALSLAHAELSEVLWAMMFRIGLNAMTSPLQIVAIFVVFAIWAVLTINILLIMEGLSAFLHALRLHWVEFQNKFYDGQGVKFTPFDLNNEAESDI